MGINERIGDESIAAIIKALTTYAFKKTFIPRLRRLIISSVWGRVSLP